VKNLSFTYECVKRLGDADACKITDTGSLC